MKIIFLYFTKSYKVMFEISDTLTFGIFFKDLAIFSWEVLSKIIIEFVASNFFKNVNIQVSQEIINVLVGRANGDRQNLKNEIDKIENFLIGNEYIRDEQKSYNSHDSLMDSSETLNFLKENKVV